MELKGKVALITGASHGLGLAIAKKFFQAGASLILVSRNIESSLRGLKNPRRKQFVLTHAIDVTKEDDVRKLFQLLTLTDSMRLSRIDIVINNAGGAIPFGDFFSLFDDDWRYVYELNCLGPMRIIRESIPLLRSSASGRIINIASLPAHQPGMFNPHYSAAKAGLLNMTKHLANVLAKENILVNAICPGTLRGGGWDRNVDDKAKRRGINRREAEKEMLREEEKKVPLGRVGELSDVAEVVLFLASSRNNFITGTCTNIDGGVTRSII